MKTVKRGDSIKREIQRIVIALSLCLSLAFGLAVCEIMTGVSQYDYRYWETIKWSFNKENGVSNAGGSGEEEKTKEGETAENETGEENGAEKDFIRWVDFTPTKEALQTAYEWDKETWAEQIHIDWISLLAYGAAKGGGKFDKKIIGQMNDFANAIRAGEKTMEEAEELKTFAYYREIYTAVLGGMVGSYRVEVPGADGNVTWQECYGLKAFSPIAKGFYYNDYDDFGAGRSYGYKRRHLGHDMMGQIGTPIIAVESGYVEAIGWNQYGGWRIGIRSLDKKRYYYYAHLRQDAPYAEGLSEGDLVTAGDVIGYMGHTGYSVSENVNNIEAIHLHLGIEIMFDESQKDSDNEIWIDCYELTKFLYRNQTAVEKAEGTKEWKRVYDMNDPALASFLETP